MKVFDKISTYYEKLIAENGYDPRSCDYGHPASQQIKFNVISQFCNFSGKSVLDVGCGFADFSNFLSAKFGEVNYTGVDISPGMVKMAKEKHPDRNILLANILEEEVGGPFDIVTANGIFYLLGENAEEISRALIEKMFSLCSEALVFNSLSIYAPNKEGGEYYADPSEVLRFCQQLSPWVVLRHEYHPNDFTVCIYKSRQI